MQALPVGWGLWESFRGTFSGGFEALWAVIALELVGTLPRWVR